MTFECAIDNQVYRMCGRGLSGQWSPRGLSDGQYDFKLKATDKTGNVVETEITGWIIDTVAPKIQYVDAPAKTNGFPHIRWMSSEEASFECSLDNGTFENCHDGRRGSWKKDNISDGEHVLAVRGTDLAGNQGKTNIHVWIVGA